MILKVFWQNVGKKFFVFCILLMLVFFALCFCSCAMLTKVELNSVKNFATKVNSADCTLQVGETLPLFVDIQTKNGGEYNLYMEFEIENKDIFEIEDFIVTGKNVGVSKLKIKAVSGIFNGKTNFVKTTINITVVEKEILAPKGSFPDGFLVGTCNTSLFENDFKTLIISDLTNLDKEGENFVLFSLFGDKSAKIDGYVKNFYFYGVIMFDNINFDWYNFTITCNSNVLCVQKISSVAYAVFANVEGKGTLTIKCEEQNFEKEIGFVVKTVQPNSVEFCSEISFLLKTGEMLDLSPASVDPLFATPKVGITVLGNSDAVEVCGFMVKAKQSGSCYVKLKAENIEKTILVCVSESEFAVSVPKREFVGQVGSFVKIDFAVFGQTYDFQTTLKIVGDTKQTKIDIMLGSLIVFCDKSETIEFFVEMRKLNTVLAKSEKIVVVFE